MIRRHLHQHPELSFEEHKTAAYIAGKLKEYGIPCETGIAGTGICATIRGNNPRGKMIALRAELDALPVEEKSGLPFSSRVPGKMHACGHDMHMASLLGCGKILHELNREWNGTVQLIFQPGEEKAPGGAVKMLKSGLFRKKKPDTILAQHVLPEMETGRTGFRSGPYMASSDELFIDLSGPGGHGAMPQDTSDLVLAASQLIAGLQQVVSRRADPMIPTVLSFGKFVADGATNVLPGKVQIEGTFRTMNEEWRTQALQLIRQICRDISGAMGAQSTLRRVEGYPLLVNHPGINGPAAGFAREYLNPGNVLELEKRMTSEDFAHFTREIPGILYRLGVKKPGKKPAPLHSSCFDPDEDALLTGTGLMAYLTFRFLHS